MNIDTWRTIALGIVAVGQTLFVALYLTYPWWKSFLGRALFFKAVSLCILVDSYMLTRVFDFENYDVVFVWLYLLLGAGVWFQFAAFLRVRLQHRQNAVSGNGGER